MGYGTDLTGVDFTEPDLPTLVADEKIKEFLSRQRKRDGFFGGFFEWLRQRREERYNEAIRAYEAIYAEQKRKELARKALEEAGYKDVDPDTFDLEKQIIYDNMDKEWTRARGQVGGDRPNYTYSPAEVKNDLIAQYEAQDAEAYRALRRKQLREESVRKWKESRKGGYKGPFDGYVSYKDLLKI